MSKTATIYRMVTPDHLCPWGLKAVDLLKRKGFAIEDHHLRSETENERFKEERHVSETPQIDIDGEHVGGYDDLREYLGKKPEEPQGTTYQPVIAIFGVALGMALTTAYALRGGLPPLRVAELFIAMSMCLLAVMKLRDLASFSIQFLGYDLLARRVVRYAYIYPFGEAGAGILMIAGLWTWLSAPAAFFIGSIGAVSVIKAVYVDKRELKCACVGGCSRVPLGFVSLTENLMMVAMAVWMVAKPALGLR